MTEESRYYSDVMKKAFNKKLMMTEEENEDIEKSTKFLICDNTMVMLIMILK